MPVTSLHQFFLHTITGRVSLVILFLLVSLLIASIMGWLPELQ